MSLFAASPFLDALGWALLNSLWQFAVLSCLYVLLVAGIKKMSAPARHSLAVYLLLAGVVWFVVSLSLRYSSQPDATAYTVPVQNHDWYTLYQQTHGWMDRLMPWWSAVYLVCITGLFVKFCLFVRRAQLLQQKGLSRLPVEWRLYVKNNAALLGIKKTIKAVVSARVDTPQVIGFLKPVILVPMACLNGLSAEQLEAVLLHELIHIRRNDYLVNLFVASAEILFFFNPFVRQLVAAIRREREYSCDDMVLQFRFQPQQYASALLALERGRIGTVTFGIAASGRGQKQLLTRVQRIVGIRTGQRKLPQAGAYLSVAMLLGCIAFVNPVKMVAEKAEPVIVERMNDPHVANVTEDNNYQLISFHPSTPHSLPKEGHKKTLTFDRTSEDDNVNLVELEPVALNESAPTRITMTATIKIDDRDFSLPEQNAVTPLPVPDETPAFAFTPYVPNNSYSYYCVPDTSIPRIKGETFAEKQAREALVKTKKAIDQLNWDRIQKQLKYKKITMEKLKAEITKELAELNWQQINQETQEQQKLNDLQRTRALMLKEQSLKQYQQSEAYYEALRQQLMQKDQLIKTTDEQLQIQRKALEDQINQGAPATTPTPSQSPTPAQAVKKKKIVYI
ncbi:MAG: hypothetical protein JST39_18060 [Bacteroidetes bacterium]|nr:hypothetical protein [Bacteroidota bacterium]